MPVILSKRVNIFCHKDIFPRVLERLHEIGIVQISKYGEELGLPDTSFNPISRKQDLILQQVRYVLDFLAPFAPKTKMLKKMLEGMPEVDKEEFVKALSKVDYEKIYNSVRDLNDRLNGLKNKREEIDILSKELSFYKNLEIPCEDWESTKKTTIFIGSIPKLKWKSFEEEIEDLKNDMYLEVITEDSRDVRFYILILKRSEDKILTVLRKSSFSQIKPPQGYKGTVNEVLKELEKTREVLEKEEEKIIKEIQSLLIYKDKLEVIFDYLSILKEREDVKKELFWTKKVLLIEGWVLEPDVEKLKKELKNIGSQMEILVFDPPEGETPPIELDNKRYVKPFEIITKLYSYPNHREPDPTPFVALFFFVFFGMCLTDAGYGIVMAVLFYLAVKKFKIGSGAKLFFKLLMYGGVATIFAGALTGSWFGNSIDLLPQSFGFLKSIKNFIMITDPMKNPIPMLAFSLLLGLIQIFTGLFIEFYSNIKAGKVKDAWMDQGSWIFFLVAILIAIGGLPFAKYLVMIGALIIVLTQGRHNKNILAKIGGGVLSLYDVVGYLGDTLSYSRLFALGLTTAAIAMIVNTIMELLSGTPIIGFLIGAVIFVFGHIFNLVINALGAFIHSARLQYVEFFTKFYEGGGLPFSPFKLKTQYVKIKNL